MKQINKRKKGQFDFTKVIFGVIGAIVVLTIIFNQAPRIISMIYNFTQDTVFASDTTGIVSLIAQFIIVILFVVVIVFAIAYFRKMVSGAK